MNEEKQTEKVEMEAMDGLMVELVIVEMVNEGAETESMETFDCMMVEAEPEVGIDV